MYSKKSNWLIKRKWLQKREGSNKTGYWKLLKIKNDTLNDILNEPINGTISGTINGTLNLILKEIENKNNITQNELIEKTGIALGTVKRVIEELKEKGYIKREGSNKTGYWKLLKSTSGTINGTINGTLNLVLKEIENKNNITQKELAEKTGIALGTVKRAID